VTVPWVSVPIEVECFGGPCDGETISVPQHLAIAGGRVRAPVDGSWRCIAARSS
jgi:hypothetical protein